MSPTLVFAILASASAAATCDSVPITHVSSLGNSPLLNRCVDSASAFAKQPRCNASLPVDVRVADMVSLIVLKTGERDFCQP
jgi:hypothetical protein